MSKNNNQALKSELVEWGHWSRAAGVMGTTAVGNSLVPMISDDRALEIDRVVGTLRKEERQRGVTLYKSRNKNAPFVYQIVNARFVQRLTVRDMAKRYCIDPAKVQRMLVFGVEQIGIGLERVAANDERY